MRVARWLTLWVGIGAVGAAFAASPPPRVSFRTAVESPECSLRLSVFPGAQPRGLPVAETFTYRSSEGDIQRRFLPRELWLARTWRGRWEDKGGNAVTLAEIDRPLPGPFEAEHVTVAEFDTVYNSRPPVNAASLVAWAETFAGRKAAGPAFAVPGGMRLADVQGILFEPGSAGDAVGYAFRLRAGPTVAQTNAQFFVLFEFPHGGAQALRPAIEREALPGISAIPRQDPAAANRRFQIAPAGAPGVQRDAEAGVSREAALRSIEGLKGWWHVETTNYVFVSDLPGARASLVRQIQADVETLRGAYARILPPFEPIRDVSVIRVFARSEDYLRYMGQESAWSGGMWMPSKRELVVRPIEFGSVRERKEWILGVVYHESVHQYLHYAYRAADIPVWYDEGHAMFFEGAEIGRDGIELGESERRAKVVDELVAGGGPEFERIVGLTHEEFYIARIPDEARRERNYATAWALVYFLRKGAPVGATYAPALERCRTALREGKGGVAATAAAFDGVGHAQLTADFREFWKSSSRRIAARRLNLLAPAK